MGTGDPFPSPWVVVAMILGGLFVWLPAVMLVFILSMKWTIFLIDTLL